MALLTHCSHPSLPKKQEGSLASPYTVGQCGQQGCEPWEQREHLSGGKWPVFPQQVHLPPLTAHLISAP